MAGVAATGLLGANSAPSLFSIGQSKGPTDSQVGARAIVDAQKREINRIRGYKPVLTPSEKFELAEIQKKIEIIVKKASEGIVRADELEDRTKLLLDADRIIGKPIANTGEKIEDKLAEYAGALEKLLEPKLSPGAQNRVDMLKRIKETVEFALESSPDSATLRSQFQNISRQLAEQNPSRPISALSVSERNAYDDLAELINATAGVQIQLSSRDTLRVAALEVSILEMQSQLGEDNASQPTAGQVSRAYMRLS